MIIRTPRKNNFTIISNDIFKVKDVSAVAKYVLIYLLSKPDDWKVNVDDVRKHTGVGRDKIYSVLDELIAAKYIEKTIVRENDGRINGYDYAIYDEPVSTVSVFTVNGSAIYGKSDTTNTKEAVSTKKKTKRSVGLAGKNKTEPVVIDKLLASFNRFRTSYPKQFSKQVEEDAWKWWKRNKPADLLADSYIRAVNEQKDNGVFDPKNNYQYIKNAHDWLDGAHWQDAPLNTGVAEKKKTWLHGDKHWGDDDES